LSVFAANGATVFTLRAAATSTCRPAGDEIRNEGSDRPFREQMRAALAAPPAGWSSCSRRPMRS
jgi:hypothetical protein